MTRSKEYLFKQKVRGLAKRLSKKGGRKSNPPNWESFIPKAYDILDARGESLKIEESPKERTAIGLLNTAEKHGLPVSSGSDTAKRRARKARSLGCILGQISVGSGRAKTNKGLSGKPSPSLRWSNLETGELSNVNLRGKLIYILCGRKPHALAWG